MQVEATHICPLQLFWLTLANARHCQCISSVTTASKRWYPDPTQVAQAVQLYQDNTSIHEIARRLCVTQHSFKSMEKIPDMQLV